MISDAERKKFHDFDTRKGEITKGSEEELGFTMSKQDPIFV